MGEKATLHRPMCAVCICALSILDAKALAGPPDGSFVPAKDPAELQARLGKILKDNGVPGMAAVIADRDGIVWTAGIGLADVAAGTPATPDTLFRVASISKTFVALSVLKLVEEGRLDLDAPVKSLVPDVAFTNKWEATDPVRVVHLLAHTTGWDDVHPKVMRPRRSEAAHPRGGPGPGPGFQDLTVASRDVLLVFQRGAARRRRRRRKADRQAVRGLRAGDLLRSHRHADGGLLRFGADAGPAHDPLSPRWADALSIPARCLAAVRRVESLGARDGRLPAVLPATRRNGCREDPRREVDSAHGDAGLFVWGESWAPGGLRPRQLWEVGPAGDSGGGGTTARATARGAEPFLSTRTGRRVFLRHQRGKRESVRRHRQGADRVPHERSRRSRPSRRRRRLRRSCSAPTTAGTRRRLRAFRAWPGWSACVGSPA